LLAGVSVVGPTKRPQGELGVDVDEGVLLLDAVPCFLGGDFGVFPDLVSVVSEVGVGGD